MKLLHLSLILGACFGGMGCRLNPISGLKAGINKPEKANIPKERGWALMDPTLMNSEPAPATAGAAASADGVETGVEGGLFDFSTVTTNNTRGTSRVAWKQSAAEAIEQARLTGKPLLVFFTSQNSAAALTMERTMVLAEDFYALTERNYIPLRIDFSDQETQRSEFYKAFKERMEPRGYPTMLVILPDGTEITRLSGYKTEYQEGYLKRLQLAVDQSKKAAEQRRGKMTKEGYRLWTNKKEEQIFAKLVGLDANMGTFTGEWGNSFTTFITRLSEKDQAWIEEQKKLRQGS